MPFGLPGDLIDPADKVLGVFSRSNWPLAGVDIDRPGFRVQMRVVDGMHRPLGPRTQPEPAACLYRHPLTHVGPSPPVFQGERINDLAVKQQLQFFDREGRFKPSVNLHRAALIGR